MGFIVAIDGPAGAGKSTVSRLVAERLGFTLVDTGAIYRSVALQASQRGIPLDDDAALGHLAETIEVSYRLDADVNHVYVDGLEVTEAIRTPEMSRAASAVSARPPVRAALLSAQRRLANEAPNGAVLEGRDIGTVVCPDARLKVFLTAAVEVRARRRFDELAARGANTTFEEVLADQVRRDFDDENRPIAPLKPAPDSVRVDTTGLATAEVVDRIVQLARDSGA